MWTWLQVQRTVVTNEVPDPLYGEITTSSGFTNQKTSSVMISGSKWVDYLLFQVLKLTNM
jgi:hypothetical protein